MNHKVTLFSFEKIPKIAIRLLEAAVKNSPSPFYDLNDYLWAIKGGKSLCFGIYNQEDIQGCFVIDIKAGKSRKILILTLLGFESLEKLKLFAPDMIEFLHDLARQNQCTDFTTLGPLAWKKLFPEMKLEGCVYTKCLI